MATDPLDALAQGGAKQTLTHAAKQGKAASENWSEDVDWYLKYVALVAKNNPRRPEKVAERPDVKAALQEAAEQASTALSGHVDEVWTTGAKLGKDHASKELKTLGVDLTKEEFTGKPDLFQKDVERLRKDFVETALDQVKEGKPVTVAKSALRAQLIVEGALRDAEAQSKGFYLDKSGLRVMWVSRLLPTTCDTCLHLHGQVVKFGTPFKELPDISLKVHGGGPLFRPPRHPWCGCYLKAVKK